MVLWRCPKGDLSLWRKKNWSGRILLYLLRHNGGMSRWGLAIAVRHGDEVRTSPPPSLARPSSSSSWMAWSFAAAVDPLRCSLYCIIIVICMWPARCGRRQNVCVSDQESDGKLITRGSGRLTALPNLDNYSIFESNWTLIWPLFEGCTFDPIFKIESALWPSS